MALTQIRSSIFDFGRLQFSLSQPERVGVREKLPQTSRANWNEDRRDALFYG
jgi:hypothetical protein